MVSSCGFFRFSPWSHPVGGGRWETQMARVFLREGVWPRWPRMGEMGGQEVDGDGEPERADGKPLGKSFCGSGDGLRGWGSHMGGSVNAQCICAMGGVIPDWNGPNSGTD